MKTMLHQFSILVIVTSLLLGQTVPVSAQDAVPEMPTPTVTEATPDPVTPSSMETPFPTETPMAATPTPIGTVEPLLPETATPTPEIITPAPTETDEPPAAIYTLDIATHPGFLTGSRNVNVEWDITGMTEGQTGLTLAVTLPEGYYPKKIDNNGETYDTETGIYTVPVNAAKGMIQIRADKVKTDIILSAILFEGVISVAEDALILPVHQQFDVHTGGGEIMGMDGKVKVAFPTGALAENALVDIGFPTDDALPQTGFSGKVFELKARAKDDENREISHFDTPLTIEVDYSDLEVSEKQENELYLYWYNPQTLEWNALETIRDKETKTLRATTDHFTVFDVGVNEWGAERVPSIESFQTAQFTGAATYSMPIVVPDGPGGFKPSIALSYNSQIVDQATTKAQASWVGMGWSLDGGGSITSNGDGTYSLTVNGVSTLLQAETAVYGSENKSGTYPAHAVDENFWKITHTDNSLGFPISWTIYDKQGNVYFFGEKANTICACGPLGNTGYPSDVYAPYVWHLSNATNTSGQRITYTYVHQVKAIRRSDQYGNLVYMNAQTATYLDTVTYGNYRIVFARDPQLRTDYPSSYDTDAVFHLYEKERLSEARVEHLDGTLIRKYVFGYAANNDPDVIWPGFTARVDGDKTLTLRSVTEYGINGAALPPHTFTYGDNLHLTLAQNGYGGSAAFTYDYWYSTITPAENVKGIKICSGGEDSTMVGWTRLSGTVYCGGGAGGQFYVKNGSAASAQLTTMMSPGNTYALTMFARNAVAGSSYRIGAISSLDNSVKQIAPVTYSSPTYTFPLNTQASILKIYIESTGTVYVGPYNSNIKRYPTFYRVTGKTVSDGNGNDYATHYEYIAPALNATDYEFRGHGQVTETAPDGTITVTKFHQDDAMKGRAYEVEVKSPNGTTRSKTESEYKKTLYTDTSNQYEWAWTYLNAQVNRIYNTSGTEVGSTRVEYDYDEELAPGTTKPLAGHYGNLLETREYEGASLYRKTVIGYSPNSSTYVVGAPSNATMYNATNQMIAETKYYYDATFSAMPGKGLLTRMEKLVGIGQYTRTDFAYDEYGNQTSVTAYNDTGAQTSTTAYDPTYHVFPISTTNALNQTTSFEYDSISGLPISMTDPNGATTYAAYDAFGRVTSVTKPGDTSASLSMSYADGYPFTTTATLNAMDYSVTRVYDGMGRETSVASGGVTTTTVYESPTVTKQSIPGDASHFTVTRVDLDNSSTTVTAPDGTSIVTASNGLVSTVTDANGHTTATTKDVWGRTLRVVPPAGPDVTYAYNELDQLIQVTRGGATTTMTYDLMGRKLSMDDPDMGYWAYAYDALGNLTSQTDARGCATQLAYDILNRLTSKTYSNCPDTAPVTYGYDAGANGIGRRTSMSDGSGSTAWEYDLRGRMTCESKVIGAESFVTAYEYNSADLMTAMTYPDGEVVNYSYNSRMMLESVAGIDVYAQSITYDAAGRLTHLIRGNGILDTAYAYFDWNQQGGRLQQLTTTRQPDSTLLQDLGYTYDSTGNILSITDGTFGPQTQMFTYDDLDRLTSAHVSGGLQGLYSEGYAYDALTGNLQSKGGVQYTYSSSHVHAVESLSNGNAYQYDANGNMTVRNVGADTFTLSYDAENHLAEVQKNGALAARFTYDGDGKRIKSEIGGMVTTFIGNSYEVTGSAVTKYYYAGSNRLAMRNSNGLHYLLSDHLGSTGLVTDAAGTKVSEMKYDAWGDIRFADGQSLTEYAYTGQYSDSYINLLDYGSRRYDPELGRFIQPDSIVPVATQGTQAYDRYAYTNNNPARYTDPSGHCISDPFTFMLCAMAAGAIIDAGYNAYSQYQQTGSIDGGEVLYHALEGAVIGGGVVVAGTAIVAGATALAPAAAVAGTAACADGDCTNEAIAAGRAVETVSQTLSADGDPTNEVTAITTYYPPNMGAAEGGWEATEAYKGQILSRIGGNGGNFFGEPGTPWWQRALPNGQASGSERLFQVEKPFPLYVSQAARWFNQPGGGVQYRTAGKYLTLDWLLENDYLKLVK